MKILFIRNFTLIFLFLNLVFISKLHASSQVKMHSNNVVVTHNRNINVDSLGNDTGSTGLSGAPFRNIQTAINYAENGDTILVNNGTYYENLVVGDKQIHLISKNGPLKTILDGNRTGMGLVIRSTNASFEGFTVSNTAAPNYAIRWVSPYGLHTTGTGIFSGDQSQRPLIKNCIIRDNEIGIYGNARVIGCKVFNNTIGYNGYWVSPQIDKCIFNNNTQSAINISNASNSKIDNSLFYDNQLVLSLRSDLNNWGFPIQISNSTITKNNNILSTSEGSKITIANSIVYGNTNPVFSFGQLYDSLFVKSSLIEGGLQVVPANVRAKMIYDSTNITSNPQFIGIYDFKLKISSPAIAKGNVLYSSGYDLLDSLRPSPQGTNPDMGAYEMNYVTPYLSAKILQKDTIIIQGCSLQLSVEVQPKVINNLFGGSNYFEMPLPGPLGANPRTFAYWIKTGNQLPMTVLTYGSSANGGYDLMDLCLNLNMSYGADNAGCSYNKGVSFFANAFGATFGKPVADSSWHHIAYVMGANNHTEFANMDVYVDGKLVSKGGNGVPFCGHNWQANSNWTFNTSSSKMLVGYKYGTNNPYTNYYKGSLSDLGVWSTALDSSQISSIIKGGAMAVSQQLIYNYKFDQLVSDSVLVDVVSGNNGILKGSLGSTSLSDGPLEGVKYKWSTGDTTATISVAPKVTTKYYVTVSSGVITRTDSVLVQVRVPSFNPLLDTILVCGLNYKLNASTGFKSYKWNTNDTTSSITINRSGRYALTVLDSNACYYKDSTYVSFLSAQLNFKDTTISKGSLINLTANSKPKVINNLFGGSNYFEMPLPGPLGANPRTFAYWIKTGNQLPMTVLTYGSSANGGYDLMDLCLNLNMSYGADNGGCSYNKGVSFFANAFGATFGKPVADSSWHHIAYVMGANNHTEFANMDVYVDGKLVSKGGNGVPFCGHNWQANSNWTFNTSSSKMLVGYKYGTNNPYTNYYKGSLSDLGVWSTALDSSQINSIIKGGAMAVSQQLMYNYKFDQLVSDSVLVDVVSGNNGILKGSLGSTSLSDGPLEGVKYKWSTGDTTATISVAPKVTTKYYVTVSNGIFSCVDSMIVRVDNFHNKNINVDSLGNDTGSTGLSGAPFRNIQTAINYAENGDTILVNNGTYYENLVVGDKQIHLISKNGPLKTILDGNRTGMGLVIRSTNASFEGFTVSNTAAPNYAIRWVSPYGLHTTGTGIFSGDQSQRPLIKNCIIRDNEIGIYGNARVIGCKVFNNTIGYNGYWVSPQIDKCIFNNNTQSAINISNASNSKIDNSLFYDNQLVLSLRSDLNNWGFPIQITNSTITKNNNILSTSEGSKITIANSIVYGNTNPVFSFGQLYDSLFVKSSLIEGGVQVVPANVRAKMIYDSTNITSNPQFIGTYDFKLKISSPAIAKGNVLYSSGYDLLDSLRPSPQGTNPDMGAYEMNYVPSLTFTTNNTKLFTCYRFNSNNTNLKINSENLVEPLVIKLPKNIQIALDTINWTSDSLKIPLVNNAVNLIVFIRIKSSAEISVKKDTILLNSGAVAKKMVFDHEVFAVALPTVNRDESNLLYSSSSKNNYWFIDGKALADSTQKIQPKSRGAYTVKVSEKGCLSDESNPFYNLTIDNLKADEGFVNLAPNPFINQLNMDFSIPGYDKLNLRILDFYTGRVVSLLNGLRPGSTINLDFLISGRYVFNVFSDDMKVKRQFKIFKL